MVFLISSINSRCWFQILFHVPPKAWGDNPIWQAYFSNGLKPPNSFELGISLEYRVINYRSPINPWKWQICLRWKETNFGWHPVFPFSMTEGGRVTFYLLKRDIIDVTDWWQMCSLPFMAFLFLEEIPNNHLRCFWNPVNNGIFIISTGAGFLPSTCFDFWLQSQFQSSLWKSSCDNGPDHTFIPLPFLGIPFLSFPFHSLPDWFLHIPIPFPFLHFFPSHSLPFNHCHCRVSCGVSIFIARGSTGEENELPPFTATFVLSLVPPLQVFGGCFRSRSFSGGFYVLKFWSP